MLTFSRIKRRFPEARLLSGKNGDEYAVNCTQFHRKGGHYKLNINAESGAFYCQDCGFAGNAIKEWFDEIDDAFEHLAIRREAELNTILAANNAPREGVFARQGGPTWEDNVPSPGRLVKFSSLDDDHPAVEYLSARGFDVEEISQFDSGMALHYCTNGIPFKSGTTTGRLVFPIYMNGILKGWQARKIEKIEEGNQEDRKFVWTGKEWAEVKWSTRRDCWSDKDIPKYLTCPGMARRDVLYGYDEAKKPNPSDNQLIVVAEGPLDKIMVGYPCVGTLGGLSSHQLRLIQTYWQIAVILRDPNIDPESRQFREILGSLSAIQTAHLSLSSGKDPGATPRHQIWAEIVQEMHRKNYEIPLHCQRN